MKLKLIYTVLAGIILVLFLIQNLAPQNKVTEPSLNQRYILMPATVNEVTDKGLSDTPRIFLLHTQTGQVWVYASYYDSEKNKLNQGFYPVQVFK